MTTNRDVNGDQFLIDPSEAPTVPDLSKLIDDALGVVDDDDDDEQSDPELDDDELDDEEEDDEDDGGRSQLN